MSIIDVCPLCDGDMEDGQVCRRRGIVTASVVGQLITAKTIKPAANPARRINRRGSK